MRVCIASCVLLIAVLLPYARAQAQEAPLHETRAVWFTTVAAAADGDWPVPGSSAEAQAARLRQRIQAAHALGLNTFVFQVIGRGDAFYPSERLPWSFRPRGAGQDPGYDPLAVAVDEAHRLGMELHVWINVFRVGDSRGSSAVDDLYRDVTDPAHVVFAHPEWVQEKDGSYWIDPSSAEARAWLVGNVMEIVNNYDIDAVHFDYIRYPQGGLNDDGASYQFDDRGFDNIADWRRDNVTQFVRDAFDAVTRAKPWVQVGSAPIGNYQSNGRWPAFYGYSDVFQESRAWLTAGINDYLAPQLYWGLEMEPDFDILVREWEAASQGRPVYAGIAAYGPAQGVFPAEQLPRLIDAARAAGAEGQVFFRYDFLMQYAALVASRYPQPALPTPMTHRFEIQRPAAPQDLQLAYDGGASVTLTWPAAAGTSMDPLRGYAVFRREGGAPDVTRAADLFAVLGDTTAFTETFAAAPTQPVYYRVVALSRLGAVSDASPVASTEGLALAAEEDGVLPGLLRLRSIYPNPFVRRATLTYEVARGTHVAIRVVDLLGREVARLTDGWQAPGVYTLPVDGRRLSGGLYFIELQAGGRRLVRSILHRKG